MIFGCVSKKKKKKLVSWLCSVHENECMLFHSVFNQKWHWKRDVFSAAIPKYRKIGKISLLSDTSLFYVPAVFRGGPKCSRNPLEIKS